MVAALDVAFLQLSHGLVILDDGRVCEITQMFDRFGDETEDPSQAMAAVARLPSGNWLSIDLSMFEHQETH